jgi:signal transduction histidine kinase
MKLWPSSLRGRLILTVLITLILTQALFFLTVSQTLMHVQRNERAQQMARQIGFMRPAIERQPDLPLDAVLMPTAFRARGAPSGTDLEAPPTIAPTIVRSPLPLPPHRIAVSVTATPPPDTGDTPLLTLMRESVPDVAQVSYREADGFGVWVQGPMRAYTLESWTPLENGRFLRIISEQTPELRAPLQALPLFDLAIRGLIGILLALIITTWIVKPLARLTRAADDTMPARGPLSMGKPIEVAREPIEIARALHAFERMRVRIGAMVAERTTMLTALAHDLRTPLTRLMLRLEMSSDATLRDEATRDCAKMHDLISRTLDYLKSAEQGKDNEIVDINTCVARAVASLGDDAGERVRVRAHDRVHAHGSLWGMERLFANVIENGVKYGTRCDVDVSRSATHALIDIVDYGAGVPAEALKRLTEPFYRVDQARNLDHGGSGLGLSIAENLVRTYRGELVVENASTSTHRATRAQEGSAPSGLLVRISLPLAARGT